MLLALGLRNNDDDPAGMAVTTLMLIVVRNMLRALLIGLLEPPAIRAAELAGDHTTRLALQEESKSLPFGAVWDFYCDSKSVPVGDAWLPIIKKYEKDVLLAR